MTATITPHGVDDYLAINAMLRDVTTLYAITLSADETDDMRTVRVRLKAVLDGYTVRAPAGMPEPGDPATYPARRAAFRRRALALFAGGAVPQTERVVSLGVPCRHCGASITGWSQGHRIGVDPDEPWENLPDGRAIQFVEASCAGIRPRP